MKKYIVTYLQGHRLAERRFIVRAENSIAATVKVAERIFGQHPAHIVWECFNSRRIELGNDDTIMEI